MGKLRLSCIVIVLEHSPGWGGGGGLCRRLLLEVAPGGGKGAAAEAGHVQAGRAGDSAPFPQHTLESQGDPDVRTALRTPWGVGRAAGVWSRRAQKSWVEGMRSGLFGKWVGPGGGEAVGEGRRGA